MCRQVLPLNLLFCLKMRLISVPAAPKLTSPSNFILERPQVIVFELLSNLKQSVFSAGNGSSVALNLNVIMLLKSAHRTQKPRDEKPGSRWPGTTSSQEENPSHRIKN